ncbi:hypothetical protein IV203_033212 [Nitzschia inconspicua]|uniref:Uncharacterized protein n=1 Tax=Nitzschia inconspicua TaxID=303405 RepID=A0A9K3KLQ8_9STRA|nr:hypothetical protein IV203_033212 [Nitzschia inconspicua]
MESTIDLHQMVFQQDPNWYQEYVLDILGEEFCSQQWAVDTTMKASSSLPSPPTATTTSATTTTTILSSTDQQSYPTTKSGSIPDEKVSLNNNNNKMSSTTVSTTSSTVVAIPNTVEWKLAVEKGSVSVDQKRNSTMDDDHQISSEIELLSDGHLDEPMDVEMDTVTIDHDQTEDQQKVMNDDDTAIQSSSSEDLIKQVQGKEITTSSNETKLLLTVDDEKRTDEDLVGDATALTLDTPLTVQSKSSSIIPKNSTTKEAVTESLANVNNTSKIQNTTIPVVNDDDDQRVVVYRSIIGNAMTSVPLRNLTLLGYTVPELERMQSDSLCVVVNDQIRIPRMGVPLQWCVQDKAAPAQVRVVDTEAQAERLIQDDIEKSQQQKQQKRKDRTGRAGPDGNDPPKSADVPETRSKNNDDEFAPKSSSSSAHRKAKQYPSPDTTNKRRLSSKSGPSRSKERLEVLSSRGSSWRNSELDDDAHQVVKKQRDLDSVRIPRGDRRSSVDRDGSMKRIYNARDPYSNGIQRQKVDRGDPPAPVNGPWVDYETFKNMLRNEAEFRVRILGERFAPTIKQESQWRLDLYKAWLWNLNDGIGESFIPPSRYERARRMQRTGGIYKTQESKPSTKDRKFSKQRKK